jgi:hypothetical protein
MPQAPGASRVEIMTSGFAVMPVVSDCVIVPQNFRVWSASMNSRCASANAFVAICCLVTAS